MHAWIPKVNVSNEARAQSLGIPSALILHAVRSGINALAVLDREDLPQVKGMVRWGRPITILRRHLKPEGFTFELKQNWPRLINGDATRSYVVMTGHVCDDGVIRPRSRKKLTSLLVQKVLHPELDLIFPDGSPVAKHERGPGIWLIMFARVSPGHYKVAVGMPSGFGFDMRPIFDAGDYFEIGDVLLQDFDTPTQAEQAQDFKFNVEPRSESNDDDTNDGDLDGPNDDETTLR